MSTVLGEDHSDETQKFESDSNGSIDAKRFLVEKQPNAEKTDVEDSRDSQLSNADSSASQNPNEHSTNDYFSFKIIDLSDKNTPFTKLVNVLAAKEREREIKGYGSFL
jgi:hypothetical protein